MFNSVFKGVVATQGKTFCPEYQNVLNAPSEEQPINPENVKVDEEEEEPEIEIVDEDF
jgi:uncharacterized Zn finger protein (UPF0148 family)